MDEAPPGESSENTGQRPGCSTFFILSMLVGILAILFVLAGSFQSNPYSQRQLLTQNVGLAGGAAIMLASVFAFLSPKLGRWIFGAALALGAVMIGLTWL